jgi:hypothetical protein
MWADRGHISFTTSCCTKRYTKVQASTFSLKVDKRILNHPEALTIGHLSAVTTTKELSGMLEQVPEKLQKCINIITKEAADKLAEHKPYDYTINLKEGETPPWGLVYALNDVELEILRE